MNIRGLIRKHLAVSVANMNCLGIKCKDCEFLIRNYDAPDHCAAIKIGQRLKEMDGKEERNEVN